MPTGSPYATSCVAATSRRCRAPRSVTAKADTKLRAAGAESARERPACSAGRPSPGLVEASGRKVHRTYGRLRATTPPRCAPAPTHEEGRR
jgi:hypothetical protein